MGLFFLSKSRYIVISKLQCAVHAPVVELVDTQDLKSKGGAEKSSGNASKISRFAAVLHEKISEVTHLVTQIKKVTFFKIKSTKCPGGGIGRHAGLKRNLSAPGEIQGVELFKFGETFIM